jgi:hypothetical protein
VSDIDIISLLQEGIRKQEEEGNAAEEDKVGHLRGGNSGCLIETEESIQALGACPRKALLRGLLIKLPDDEDMNSKAWMFSAGHLNEEGWAGWLHRSWASVPGQTILREADVPTYWKTRNNTPVTGRPDIVLARDGTNILGLELKQASSIWTVRDVLQDKPKTPHLCQAGHYSWQLGVPFELHYANRVNYHVMGAHLPWVGRHFPRYGARHSDKCDYKLGEPTEAKPETTYKNGKVKEAKPAKPAYQEIFRVLPFVHGFKLRWDVEGTLHYRPVDMPVEEETRTLITKEGIQEYYETAASAVTTNILPPRPAMLDATGEPAKWNDCTYCPMAKVCDLYQGNTSGWLKEVKKEIDTQKKNAKKVSI